tara:strand:+ start:1178 stop:1762 length:585 start_codon:yes stop_codon:yes gene_type:complete
MIIGLVGYKGSGKTTACNIIKKHLDDVVQINFKDALVQELKDNFPDLLIEICRMNYEENWRDEIVPSQKDINDLFTYKPPLVRTLMQNYGTNVVRKRDSDHWVNSWDEKVFDEVTDTNKSILTDDVRFLNEATKVKRRGGILIRLERTDLKATDTHQSETEQQQIECDYTISVGAGELDKLESELVKILSATIK